MGTHIYDLMQQPPEYDRHLASMRLVTSGAGPDSLFVSAQERYDFKLVRVYGCGEAPGHAIGRPDDPEDARLLEDGVPFPGVQTRIIGLDGAPVDAGQVGEYECRGPNLFMGYVGQDDLTDETITSDGFYRSGDRMRLGKTGYISWSGRSKEIIRRGGLQIDPLEIETMLSNHPKVETVVVVGRPDDRLGERAVIVAVPSAGSSLDLDDLTRFLLDHGLPKNCLPEALYEVPEVPRTELGKLHRARVRNELIAGEYDRGSHV
jgi:acyl-CoA synthetase (AMP-forming)/AMP-acid ligase II